ncbi:SRPBCC family protein [Nocardioides jensenii]|uniref:SRPBCC family protein n=1 Tax=Nocardioides jensenii TaxID=1843 RepID=UPI000832EA91|nr:SRPBCC family protein [Nocardioides jensenii]
MTFNLDVDVARPPAEVFAWLADLRNRPRWQASLRGIELAGEPPYGVGTRWIDVTWPGVRPRMEVTGFEPGMWWAEQGRWHGLVVDLVLEFLPSGAGTTVRATASTHAPGWRRPLGWALDRIGPVAARDDLRRAARLLEG